MRIEEGGAGEHSGRVELRFFGLKQSLFFFAGHLQ